MGNLLLHDLKYYLRNIKEFFYIYVFFIAVIALFVLAAPPGGMEAMAPTALWLALVFSLLLAAPNLFERDAAQGMVEYWRLLPISMEAVVLARLIALFLLQVLPLLALMPLAGLLLGLPPAEWWPMAGLLALGALPVLALVVMAAAMLAGLGQQGGLVALLILPLLVPLMIFGVGAMQGVLEAPYWLLAGLAAFSLPLSVLAAAACLRAGE
jgi:heme exporter protein B